MSFNPEDFRAQYTILGLDVRTPEDPDWNEAKEEPFRLWIAIIAWHAPEPEGDPPCMIVDARTGVPISPELMKKWKEPIVEALDELHERLQS